MIEFLLRDAVAPHTGTGSEFDPWRLDPATAAADYADYKAMMDAVYAAFGQTPAYVGDLRVRTSGGAVIPPGGSVNLGVFAPGATGAGTINVANLTDQASIDFDDATPIAFSTADFETADALTDPLAQGAESIGIDFVDGNTAGARSDTITITSDDLVNPAYAIGLGGEIAQLAAGDSGRAIRGRAVGRRRP